MPALIINQEGMLDWFAHWLQADRADLSNDDIRFALAFYHAAYLPVAALVELRANELDQTALYEALGFTPNVSSIAVATLRVTVPAAPTGAPYYLAAPFTVRQGNRQFLATTNLNIPAGQTQGTANLVAQAQGSMGTPVMGSAQVASSVGWLRGATVMIDSITPGIDGDDRETMALKFREFAANPDSLVRAIDHTSWLHTNAENISRAITTPRFETEQTPLGWTGQQTAGHLTVAILGPGGVLPDEPLKDEIKNMLLEQTIPYGPDALHVVGVDVRPVTGLITVKATDGMDKDLLRDTIIETLNTRIAWDTWPHQQHVYAGHLWSILAGIGGVDHVQQVDLDGRLILDNSPATHVYELNPWELPQGAFNMGMVTVN